MRSPIGTYQIPAVGGSPLNSYVPTHLKVPSTLFRQPDRILAVVVPEDKTNASVGSRFINERHWPPTYPENLNSIRVHVRSAEDLANLQYELATAAGSNTQQTITVLKSDYEEKPDPQNGTTPWRVTLNYPIMRWKVKRDPSETSFPRSRGRGRGADPSRSFGRGLTGRASS